MVLLLSGEDGPLPYVADVDVVADAVVDVRDAVGKQLSNPR